MYKGLESAVELNQRHKWMERCIEDTGRGLEYLADKIQSLTNKR
jgi:hypothetical protein